MEVKDILMNLLIMEGFDKGMCKKFIQKFSLFKWIKMLNIALQLLIPYQFIKRHCILDGRGCIPQDTRRTGWGLRTSTTAGIIFSNTRTGWKNGQETVSCLRWGVSNNPFNFPSSIAVFIIFYIFSIADLHWYLDC